MAKRLRTAVRFAGRWSLRALAAVGVFGTITAVLVAAVPFPMEALAPPAWPGTRVTARDGTVLLDVPGSAGTRSRPVGLEDVSPFVIAAVKAAEDKRFDDHAGIDGLALLRAGVGHLIGDASAGGASTLTQQVVKRTWMAGRPRTLGAKLEEAVWALRLEAAAPKDTILETWLNRVDFGNRTTGIEAAAQHYFGTSARRLAPSQAALLAGLPNAPDRLDPRRHPARARARAHAVLRRMHAAGDLDDAQLEAALSDPLHLAPVSDQLPAAWLTTRLKAELAAMAAPPRVIQTTLDARLQRDLERLAATPQHPQPGGMPTARGGQHQVGIVVLDTASGEVRAWVGSRGWSDTDALGRTDAVSALRQPGSALKPFIHAMLIEAGASASTLLPDAPAAFQTPQGLYRPENYDRRYRGEVTLAEALGSSLNIPAVHAAMHLGLPRVLGRLKTLGLGPLDRGVDHYGPGLALGGAEVRLIDLAQAYATLGRLGQHLPTRWLATDTPSAPVPVIDRTAAREVLEILSDDRVRGIGFGHASALNLPFRVAVKTGTSSDRRDNLAFGVTPDYTVGVWVGHFDGSPVETAAPHLAAAPVLRAVLQRLYPGAARRGDVRWFAPGPRRPGARSLEDPGSPVMPEAIRDPDREGPAPALGALEAEEAVGIDRHEPIGDTGREVDTLEP